MGYSYSPSSRDERARAFFSRKGKHLLVAAVIVFFIGTFYLVGNTLTGYVTYSKDLEQQLNSTNNELSALQVQKEACDADLQNANSDIGGLNSSLNTCTTNLFSSKLFLDSCNKDKEKLNEEKRNLSSSLDMCRAEKDTSAQSYRQLARNSVKAICCSFGDVQSATIRNWNITNNSIVCSGTYTINCTSGESNY
jgi:hypothetical protein